MRTGLRRAIAILAVTAAAGLTSTSQAYAGTPTPTPASGEGPITVTLSTGPALPVPASVAGIADKTASCSAKTTYLQTWSLTMKSILWGIPWSETQKGSYYFNSCTVWQASRQGSDNQGFHRCGYASGVGFSLSDKSCYKTGDPSSVGSYMTLGDQFQVTALIKGFPISATHEMAVCAYPGGKLVTCKWS